MKKTFADTSYWIALLLRDDRGHKAAHAAKAALGLVLLVTTDEVLTEFLNYFCARGQSSRNFP
jgi:hypothetical protein